MQELADQLRGHLKAVSRHRWYAVGCAWVIAVVGWIAIYHIPTRYEADARIYVDTQSVLRPLLSGLAVQPNLDQVVALMGQTLISRPNLEKVVSMSGLDANLTTQAQREELIHRLSKEMSVRGVGKDNLYEISYVGKDAAVAKKIVQSLLTLFVEGSLVDNKKDTESAEAFIDEQLNVYRDKLEEAEAAITKFKRQHVGFMPGEGPSYFARLDEAKLSMEKARMDLKEAQNSAESIRNRLSTISELPPPTEESAASPAAPETELDRRIASMQQRLDILRLTYTEEHPDIVALVRSIDQLKTERKAEMAREYAKQVADASSKGTRPGTAQIKNPLFQQLSLSLASAEANVAMLRTRVSEYEERYAQLHASAGVMPEVEVAYTQLTRDYELNKSRYAELLKRRDSAQISKDMQSSDSAVTFRVVDPPRVIALTPNPLFMATLVLLAAFGGGIAVAVLISLVQPTIGTEGRLRQISGLRVLGTVVMTMTDTQKLRARRSLTALLVSIAGLLSAYAAIMTALLAGAKG